MRTGRWMCRQLTGLTVGLAAVACSSTSPELAGPNSLIEDALDRLDEGDVTNQRTLILSLGDIHREDISASHRARLSEKLLEMYGEHTDPGIHSAIGWLLGRGWQGEQPRAMDWELSDALAAIDAEVAGQPSGARRWFETAGGQTLAVIDGPVEFVMGSPENEVGRTADEVQHRVHIPRSFAIAMTEVTVGQFQRFLSANPVVQAQHVRPDNPSQIAEALQRFSPDDDGPQTMMTWYEAAMFCNWLSQEEGLPESEWVYPTDFLASRTEMTLPVDYLQRIGYRLPTEAEWEFAARAGSTTARFFGESDDELDQC